MTRAAGGCAIENQEQPKPSRRAFNQLLAMTGAAVAAIGAWILLRGRFGSNYPARVVAQAGEIPVGGFKIFTYPTDVEPCILLRPAENTYVAFSRTCTHASCPVHYQPGDNRLFCPCHQGFFSAADGSVLSGPPPRPLPRILLDRRGADILATGVVRS
ncbi:MAG TPA: Rieske (2Fe-2S) protein [Candidatus Limnocylindrales bacterium]|nr:Rieske (2Fe-2S) protein [Candidatus Limnocylindrales bacterium]